MDQNTLNFKKIIISPDYKLDVGTGSAPLECAADYVSMDGPGTLYFKARDSAGTEWLDKLYQTNGTVYLDGTDEGGAGAETIALVSVLGGRCFMQTTAGSKITDIEVLGREAFVDIDANWTGALTNILVRGGQCFCSSPVGTLCDVSGGTFVAREAMTIATLTLREGGTFDHQTSGTITAVNQYGGMLTATRNQETAATITTLNGWRGVSWQLGFGLAWSTRIGRTRTTGLRQRRRSPLTASSSPTTLRSARRRDLVRPARPSSST
jgi:hypothetical protein